MIRKFPREIKKGDIFKEEPSGHEYVCSRANIEILNNSKRVLKVVKKRVRPERMYSVVRVIELMPYPYFCGKGGNWFYPIKLIENKPKVIFTQKFWLVDNNGLLRVGYGKKLTFIRHEES